MVYRASSLDLDERAADHYLTGRLRLRAGFDRPDLRTGSKIFERVPQRPLLSQGHRERRPLELHTATQSLQMHGDHDWRSTQTQRPLVWLLSPHAYTQRELRAADGSPASLASATPPCRGLATVKSASILSFREKSSPESAMESTTGTIVLHGEHYRYYSTYPASAAARPRHHGTAGTGWVRNSILSRVKTMVIYRTVLEKKQRFQVIRGMHGIYKCVLHTPHGSNPACEVQESAQSGRQRQRPPASRSADSRSPPALDDDADLRVCQ
jgi:hypothetical protein